jgi:hypothetical protein
VRSVRATGMENRTKNVMEIRRKVFYSGAGWEKKKKREKLSFLM